MPATPNTGAVSIPIEDGELVYYPNFVPPDECPRRFETLMRDIPWCQEFVKMYGKQIPMPRLTAWIGDPGRNYTYSGTTYEPVDWPASVKQIREQIAQQTGVQFNTVLANLYRDGRDSMGWHADNEPELGTNPVIASVSLGSVRTFQLRHRKKKDQRVDLKLESGSLLLMAGPLQHHWRHAIPKTTRPMDARINLTFRNIL